MKRSLVILCLLAAVALGTEVRVMAADPNACEQTYVMAPDWADPNLVQEIILPANNDPNNLYERPTGKMVRQAPYCDPDGDAVVVDVNSPDWSVSIDPASLTWTLAGDVKPGPNYVYVTATDAPGPYRTPISVAYTMLVWGIAPENHGPVLH